MKRNSRTLAAVAFVSVAAFSFLGLRLNSQNRNLSELQLANVEALVDNGEGTPVGDCYMNNGWGSLQWEVFCDDRSSSSMIYPCNYRLQDRNKGLPYKCTK